MDAIKSTLESYILKEFLPGDDRDELTDETPLITGGILDSLATLNQDCFSRGGALHSSPDGRGRPGVVG